jgi:hypothetical protein
MKPMAAGLGSLVLTLGVSSTALAQPVPPPPRVQVLHEEAPNPDTRWVHSYATGQWVYTSDYGWIWVPTRTTTTVVDGVPYAHLYTSEHGWTWYVSPWGFGRYHYGPWVTRTWHPAAWRGVWIAPPQVRVRLGVSQPVVRVR